MKDLPEKFTARMKAQLGAEYPAFLSCYDNPPVRGLRVNTLKTDAAFLMAHGFALSPSQTLEEGYVLNENVPDIGVHPYHMAGLFYMQEPSAMSAVAACNIQPGMRVLDMCAAPGGKSGGIAARLKGEGFLLCNEPIPSRARTLAFNMQRLGITNCAVSVAYPDATAEALGDIFDVVLVDAPCSGEGMFRKDAAAIAEWSLEHVSACAVRQRAILQSAAACTIPGGALVYSTCTFSQEENEGVIEDFLKAHPSFTLEFMRRFYPHTCAGEGHFVARMRRVGETQAKYERSAAAFALPQTAFSDFIGETFAAPPAGKPALLKDGRVMLLCRLPENAMRLRLLFAGVEAGELKKDRFMPSYPLFLACHGGEYRYTLSFAANDARLKAFLHGETIPVPERFRGWCAVAADGYNLGFGKAVNGVLKNHIPKGIRTRACPESLTRD